MRNHLYNSREERLVDKSAQYHFTKSSHSECGSREAESKSRQSNVVSRPPSRRMARSTASRITAFEGSGLGPDPERLAKAASSETVVTLQSPAVTALRRFSQAPLDTRPMPNVARRISTALSATLDLRTTSKSLSSGSRSPEIETIRSSMQSSHQGPHDTSVDQDGRLQGPISRHQLKIPTTITVRKASNARQTEGNPACTKPTDSPDHLESQENASQINPPSVELVAFFCENRRGDSPQNRHATSSTNAEASFHHSDRQKSITQFSDLINSRRQSATAEVALTFADVHIAPGTFATQQMPKLDPPRSTDIAQRVSTVQFRSRISVHEVIWREDEATSGSSVSCSSHGSSSPDRSTQFQTIGGLSPDGEASPSQPSQVDPEQSLHVPFLSSDIDPSFTQPQAELLQFAWSKPMAASAPEFEESSRGAMRIKPVAQSPIQDLPKPKMVERPSAGEGEVGSGLEAVSHVASFPPLPGRQSTLEWCRTPPIDLDETLTGRGEADTYSAGRRVKSVEVSNDPDEDDGGQYTKRWLSDYCQSPPKIGSSLGISSHQSKPQRRVC